MQPFAGSKQLLLVCLLVIGCQSPNSGNSGNSGGGGATDDGTSATGGGTESDGAEIGTDAGTGTGGGAGTGGGTAAGGGTATDGGTGTDGGMPHAGLCGTGCSSGRLCCQVSMLNDVPESQRTYACLTPTAGVCPAPDLIVDPDRMLNNYIERKTFGTDSCAVDEQCVDASGERRLLRFPTRTVNQGQRDLVLGDPLLRPDLFQYFQCHMHYHFSGYASYRLLAADGRVVGRGRKQSFCLGDNEHVSGPQTSPQYYCTNQGISAGWADEYGPSLDCQWIDITDVAPGNYQLEITVNPDRILLEGDYANNASRVPVTIP